MCLDRTLSHIQLFRDFRVIAPLEQQVGDLPLPRTQANQLVLHKSTSPFP